MYREAQAKAQPRSRRSTRAGARGWRHAAEGRRDRRRVQGSRREEVMEERGAAAEQRAAPRTTMRDYYAVLEVECGSHDGADPSGVPAPGAALLPRRQLLGARRAGALRGDRRGLPRPERSDRALGLRPAGRAARRTVRPDPSEPPRAGRRGGDVHVAGRARRSRRRSPGSRRTCRSSDCHRARPVAPPARPGRQPTPCSHCGGAGNGLERAIARTARRVPPATGPASAWRSPARPAAAAAPRRAARWFTCSCRRGWTPAPDPDPRRRPLRARSAVRAAT